ncbi:MAG: hypothetical protein PHQ65_08415 [Bacteroidales bacterium]|nr:hypothetical protein [Bacteroidales bacterium]MDD3665274.1 hypothetical protein [Bacteroidales bacterium]
MDKVFLHQLTKAIAFVCLCSILLFPVVVDGQERVDQYKETLDTLERVVPGLAQRVDLSFNKTPLPEVIRSIGMSNQINFVIDQSVTSTITYSFSDVSAKDVILFLCREYNLELLFSGRIIKITSFQEKKILLYSPPKIKKEGEGGLLSVDLKADSAQVVAKYLTELSGINVVCAPEVRGKLLSGFYSKVALPALLELIAASNNLDVSGVNEGYLLKDQSQLPANNSASSATRQYRTGTNLGSSAIKVVSRTKITANTAGIGLKELIEEVFRQCHLNYFLLNEPEGKTSVNVQDVTLSDLLNAIFRGTKYSYAVNDSIYYIGEKTTEGIRKTEIYRFKNRAVTGISEIIPESARKDLTIKEFVEQNSLIIGGDPLAVKDFAFLLQKIDQIVPLVLIEVMIIDNQTGYIISTGITAGVGETPATSGGTILSGVDYTLSGSSINKLLNSFSGFGSANLGKVNPNFYLSIKALEEQGVIKVKSTPLLTTLNGHEATLKVGNTQYYLEETSDFIVTQSTQQRTTKRYNSVNADFTLKLVPYVSGYEQITLEVAVDQSDFTDRISKEAPPGQTSRSFKSIIRVQNGEMILLGGLESSTQKESGSGVPLLSRIPVVKWFFSSRTKEKKATKLNVFIKPTILL